MEAGHHSQLLSAKICRVLRVFSARHGYVFINKRRKKIFKCIQAEKKTSYFILQAPLLRNGLPPQRQASHSAVSTIRPKDDGFASWMCSWSIEQSLWSSDVYRNALLKYIGRIYKQETHMYRLFLQLKNEMQKLDELDLLNKLIEKTKERRGAY
jgi:hypothetical protein